MPATLIVMNRLMNQHAVLWDAGVTDGEGGFTFVAGSQREIHCRWEEKQEEFIDTYGERALSRAVVQVDCDITLPAFLALGSIVDLGDSSAGVGSDPTDSAIEAWPVRSYSKLPLVPSSTQFLRTVYL